MRLKRKKPAWQRLSEPVTAQIGKTSVRSGLLAAGAAAGLTALSSAVSSLRKKQDS